MSGISKIVNCGILIGMPFWALLPLVCPGHRLTFQIFVISMFLVCLLTKGAYLATIFCKQSEKISKKHVRSECKFLTKIEKLRGKREGQAKNRTRFVLGVLPHRAVVRIVTFKITVVTFKTLLSQSSLFKSRIVGRYDGMLQILLYYVMLV